MIIVNSDDADEGDCELVIDQAELLREILLTRYQKFINHILFQILNRKTTPLNKYRRKIEEEEFDENKKNKFISTYLNEEEYISATPRLERKEKR